MAKKKSAKTEEEIVEPAKEEDVNVDDIVDGIENSETEEEFGVDEINEMDEKIEALNNEEKPSEEKPDQSHVTMVSGLQPHRPKPGYPQNLKHHRGFGYQP